MRKLVCRLIAIITPSQIGLTSICRMTGPTIGTTTKMISMKSRKKPRTNITTITAAMAPKAPPGN